MIEGNNNEETAHSTSGEGFPKVTSTTMSKISSVENNFLDLLLLLLLMSQLQILRELLQALAVVQLDLAASSIKLLQLLNERDLWLDAYVQASQLFIQLETNVCEEKTMLRWMTFHLQKRPMAFRFVVMRNIKCFCHWMCVDCDRITIGYTFQSN